MAQQTAVPIHFLITDLEGSGIGFDSILRRLRPSKSQKDCKKSKKLLSLYHFAPFKHWAVKIRDRCYEINLIQPEGKKLFVLNDGISFAEWEETCKEKKVSWEPIEVGATIQSDQEISQRAQLVWQDHLQQKYKCLSQNCQNFAYCLYRTVALEPEKIDEEVARTWKRLPFRITQVRNIIQRMAPLILRGLVIEGVELTLEGAALLGLEAVGLSLLGPVGEIILIASIIIPLFLVKSNDKKWLRKIDKLIKKKPAIVDGTEQNRKDMVTEACMEQIIEELAGQSGGIDVNPSHELGRWGTPQKIGTTSIKEPPAYDDLRYHGYNKNSIDRYTRLGFSIEHVVAVFQEWKIGPNNGDEFDFDLDDHKLIVSCLLGAHGFDQVVSASVFTVPRKPLPKNTATDHWASLIDSGTSLPEKKLAELNLHMEWETVQEPYYRDQFRQ